MPLSGLHILVVEDEALIALDTEHLLIDAGAGSVTICTRAQFEEILEAEKFDAMLVDTGPDRSTLETDIARARELGVRIAFTTSDTELVAGIDGFDGIQFIAKPYDARHINALVFGLRGPESMDAAPPAGS